MTVLTVDGLSKTFDMHVLGDTRVVGLDDVSFDVREGEFLAVVGESGSGKSSLLKCLYRTYDPTGGRIVYHRNAGSEDAETAEGPADVADANATDSVDSVDLAACDDRTIIGLRGDAIGYTSQFLDEIPRVPAVDVVARPLREQGVPTADARERARDLLSRLNLPEELWEAYPATFSGGERQRVNLAQALAPRPDLLLLDEPTSALDPETRQAAIDLLRAYLDSDTTVVGVFHNTAVIEAVADRVVVLDDGRVDRIVPVADFEGAVVG
ncbi:phosphonate C-P lyase system protein PhnL [Haloarcula laminariae]|uniref:phosphonate C-P lyase system protein PhnL n=1 Tax=Haloarcula laminariae TaxID=2961577 RepID=UPI0021C5E9CD|nr:ATP-binding cassette domain-containing protein [Halomicroarcula laminariae]